MFANVDGLLDALAAAVEGDTLEVTVRNTPSSHQGFEVEVAGQVFGPHPSVVDAIQEAVVAGRAGAFVPVKKASRKADA